MLRKLENEMSKREAFEVAKAPNAPLIELRRAKQTIIGNRRFAAFMAAISADPSELLNKVRKEGYRSNLKGIQKVKSLVEYVNGRSNKFDRVSLALFAVSIIAAKKGIDWISNEQQMFILSSLDVPGIPEEVREAVRYYQAKHLTLAGDAANQACQFRTTFNNLGLFTYANRDVEERNLNGIQVNLNSPVIQYLSARWKLDQVA
jgi:hypothetical protein